MRHLLLLAGLLPGLAAAEMAELSADEMGTVTGQEGISFEWDLRINADANGNSLCPGTLTNVECRMAIKFANREESGGEWLVFKQFSGRLNFTRFNLDADTSPAGASPYADTSRFEAYGGGVVSPYNKPRLLMTFPEPLEIYNFRIGGMSIEYGNGAGGTGFLAPSERSFIGLAINNSIANQPATLALEGNVLIFGF